MQVPIGPDLRREAHKGIENLAHGLAFSIESQLKLRGFYDYLDSCHGMIGEIHKDLSYADLNSASSPNLQKASEELGKFCLSADEWGFNSLYEVGQGLQRFLLNACVPAQNKRSHELIDRGLALLSALVEQCESEFRWRLVIADTIEAFNRAADAVDIADM
jgi:hypothetical protein